MVAITVILAAVIAAFVLDLGDSIGENQVNAVVATDLDNEENEITVTVEQMGDATAFELRGDGDEDALVDLTSTGDQEVLDSELDSVSNGEIRIVAVSGDAETIVATQDWSDW